MHLTNITWFYLHEVPTTMMVVERGQQENELSDGHRILDSYLGLRFFCWLSCAWVWVYVCASGGACVWYSSICVWAWAQGWEEAVEYPALELPFLFLWDRLSQWTLNWAGVSRLCCLEWSANTWVYSHAQLFIWVLDQTQVSKLMSKSSSFPEPSLQALFEIVLLVSQTGLKLMNFSDPLATALPRAETESKSQLSSRIEALQDATLWTASIKTVTMANSVFCIFDHEIQDYLYMKPIWLSIQHQNQT